MLVVCNGVVCWMYTLADGTVCYQSERTGEIVKRDKSTRTTA